MHDIGPLDGFNGPVLPEMGNHLLLLSDESPWLGQMGKKQLPGSLLEEVFFCRLLLGLRQSRHDFPVYGHAIEHEHFVQSGQLVPSGEMKR